MKNGDLIERTYPLPVEYDVVGYDLNFTWFQVGGAESDFSRMVDGNPYRRPNRFRHSPDGMIWDGAGGSPIAKALPINGAWREFVPQWPEEVE